MRETVSDLVSVIIPVRNRPEMLAAAVESVFAQTWKSFEIIISDDGSSDDTVELGQALAAAHPRVVTYLWSTKRGAGPAREAGRQRARGEFIQYLDSDDTLWPRKFEVQIAALRHRPDCHVAYGWIRLCPEDGAPSTKPHKWSGKEIPQLFPKLLVDRWWNTDTPLWRRSIVDSIGPWSSLQYSQDWEYDARAGALGVRLAYCPQFVCDQRHHATNRQTGTGQWLSMPERVVFFTSLYHCAKQAGVLVDAPEMRHFSRWVFANARMAGECGYFECANEFMALASRAIKHRAPDLWLFALVVRTLGWRSTVKAGQVLQHVLGRRSGKNTLKQSWMS